MGVIIIFSVGIQFAIYKYECANQLISEVGVVENYLIHYYREMMRIRRFEQSASSIYEKGELPGFLHLSIGQEAVAVGVCSQLNKEDYILTTHRGHGHVLAKGMKMKEMFAELFAKKTGSNRGKGGSMHIMDSKIGVLGANGVVGAGIPIAAGVGLSSQMQQNGRMTVAFFGDGASNTGAFHEGLNMAAVWNLPVLFVCENNKFSESTSIRNHQRNRCVADRAMAYGIPGIQVDGNDVEAVANVTAEAIERARRGEGPTLIEADTYRLMGHYLGDKVEYRSESEYEHWKNRDPIELLEQRLRKAGLIDDPKKQAILEEIEQEIRESIDFARRSPEPDQDDAFLHVYQ